MTDRRLLRAPLLAAALIVAGAAWMTPAAAQQGEVDGAQACTPDVYRLCNHFIPDRQRITACLFKKRLQLSPACRTVMKPRGKAYRHARR